MKSISTYISEKLRISSTKKEYEFYPNDKIALSNILEDIVAKNGYECDLNIVNVSKIYNMSHLFNTASLAKVGNIDISEWDVSNVKDMSAMFYICPKFSSDLSQWDVSNLMYAQFMFNSCIKFNSDLSEWNTCNLIDARAMFFNCRSFNSNLSKWNVSNLKSIEHMFDNCRLLDSNFDSWDVSNVYAMKDAFYGTKVKLPKWYKDK